MSRAIISLLVVTVFTVLTDDAQAQLFGQRNLGASSLRPRSPQGFDTVGEFSGDERFIRGNRDRRAFVGSDAQETREFVGSEQSTNSGQVISTTTGLRPPPDRSQQINTPYPARSAGTMYSPRYSLEAVGDEAPTPQSMEAIAEHLESSDSFRQFGEISVSVEGRTATLRGTVSSESDRRLAAIIAGFEPGISRVQNDLSVNPALKSPPLPPDPIPEPNSP